MNAAQYYYDLALNDLLAQSALDTFATVGNWDLNQGDSQYSHLGSSFTDIFGAYGRLVCSPLGWLTGSRTPTTNGILGLGDDVSFCYGARTNATYGGPHFMINRGPLIKKLGINKDADTPGPPSPLSAAYDALADANLEGDKALIKEDKSLLKAVTALNLCVTLTTALLDFTARIIYREAAKNSKEKWSFLTDSADVSAELAKIQISHRILPRRLLATVYHLEVACSWKQLGDASNSSLKKTAAVAGTILAIAGTMGGALASLAIIGKAYLKGGWGDALAQEIIALTLVVQLYDAAQKAASSDVEWDKSSQFEKRQRT